MKGLFSFVAHVFLFCLALSVQAEDMENGMQGMMRKLMEVEKCMANIDQAKFKDLEKRSEEVEKNIDTLCNGGKRDEAEKLADKFSKEMQGDDTVKKVVACAKPMDGMLNGAPFVERDKEAGHVCDEP
ncbi:MAG: hypothetical protein OEZ47_12460 [Gammaproteobacteria bacterium]|nr:hypothetical protein [Gammaproteobacteria bacterium]